MPFAGLRMRVGNRPGLLGEVELAPLGEGELAAALQREQEHSKDVRKALEAAGVVQIPRKAFSSSSENTRARGFSLPPGR